MHFILLFFNFLSKPFFIWQPSYSCLLLLLGCQLMSNSSVLNARLPPSVTHPISISVLSPLHHIQPSVCHPSIPHSKFLQLTSCLCCSRLSRLSNPPPLSLLLWSWLPSLIFYLYLLSALHSPTSPPALISLLSPTFIFLSLPHLIHERSYSLCSHQEWLSPFGSLYSGGGRGRRFWQKLLILVYHHVLWILHYSFQNNPYSQYLWPCPMWWNNL